MKKYSLYFMSLALIVSYIMVSFELFFAVYVIAFSYHLGQNTMSVSAEISWLVYMILVGAWIFKIIKKTFKEEKLNESGNIRNTNIDEPDSI